MFKIFFTLSFVFLIIGNLSAQTFIGEINPFPEKKSNSNFADTIRILGVMVNFQEDRDGTTFGNGKFGSIYSKGYGNTILDPLPHDRSYFESHLEFVKNYFYKVSNNQVHIEYFILSDTFSVSQTMRNYSPEPNSGDFIRTANFAKETWTIAASMNPGINFNNYDIFTIFHAGVGRDVSLPGSLGNERDLPSVYLGDQALKEILNNDLTGLPINREGKYNSMIIPETESREVSAIGGTVLFELSINGLLAASLASHLGLPDLFNTETGLSAIGRFGLMDGQSIFAYSGTYPPEPSAWEKIYLGWETPVTVDPGNFNINLITGNAAAAGDTVILKVPINSLEYYLVENRIRDASSNGSIVTYITNGETRTKVFTKDTTGYESFSVDSLEGVVIDIDEFDWAIPDTRSVETDIYDPVPGGGIVIWHIDDKIINEKIKDNKINVDENNRGVDVEEADGIQDIGERFFTIFGDEIIGEGFVEDFWYSDNPAEFFENSFSKDTRPSTETNSGANSLITFSNFSPKSNRMSFNLNYGDSLVKPIFSRNLNLELNQNNFLNVTQASPEDYNFNLVSGTNLYILNPQGQIDTLISNFSEYKTASVFRNNIKYTYGAKDSIINLFSDNNLSRNTISISVGEMITSAPVVVKTPEETYQVLVGTESGKVRIFNEYLNTVTINQAAENPIIKIAADGSYYSLITADSWHSSLGQNYNFISGTEKNINKNNIVNHEEAYDLVLTKDENSNYISIILYNHNRILIISDGQLKSNFDFDGMGLTSISVTDLKQDGKNYILFPVNSLEARNLTGALADNFPFSDPDDSLFNILPLSADFHGDNKAEVLAFSTNGNIFGINSSGRVVENFPISAGEKPAAVPVLFNNRGKISLAVIDISGNFTAWNIGPTEGLYYWSEENGNNQNTSFINSASSSNNISGFFPAGRVYNYPNPVYEGVTYIRYYVSEDANVNIKIFDLAGGLVEELNDNATGGFDNETEWNINEIQSGVYLARVEATGSSGKSENKIIKIAVIK